MLKYSRVLHIRNMLLETEILLFTKKSHSLRRTMDNNAKEI